MDEVKRQECKVYGEFLREVTSSRNRFHKNIFY